MDLKQYHTLWNDAWKFLKHYAEQQPLSDDKWGEVCDMVDRFAKTHDDEWAAGKVAVMVFNLLEHEYKQMKRR